MHILNTWICGKKFINSQSFLLRDITLLLEYYCKKSTANFIFQKSTVLINFNVIVSQIIRENNTYNGHNIGQFVLLQL